MGEGAGSGNHTCSGNLDGRLGHTRWELAEGNVGGIEARGTALRRLAGFCIVAGAVVALTGAGGAARGVARAGAPRLVLARQHPTPVITTRSPGAEGNRYGFEGGRVVKVDGTYHLFTTEMVADPMWVKTRFGHWISRDRLAWTRVATVRESSGEFEGKDPRAALWSPLPVWDPGEGRWNLFYVAYRSMPTDGTRFLLNHAGEIWRAVSRTAGPQGIGGPFEDVGVIMRPGPDSLGWEGLQGTDSFFPWPVGGRWRAFYGSARTETRPVGHWLVGPAEAPSLAGPWRRVREDNPAAIETRFIENPIVTEVPGGGWLAVSASCTRAATAIRSSTRASNRRRTGHASSTRRRARRPARSVSWS